MRNKNKAGFTLIELLVVIAIIGLLASVVLLALNSARAKSRDAKRLADIRQLASAFELYFNDVNGYPTKTTPAAIGGATIGYPPINPTYIGLIPSSPTPPDGTCGSDALGTNDYWMAANSTGASQSLTSAYAITFCLGAQTGGYGSGPHTLTQAGIQ